MTGPGVTYNYILWSLGRADSALLTLDSLLASVSVGFRSKETPRNGILPARNWGESKIRKRGWGRGRKETLADKPLDFENLRSPANGAHDWLDQSNIIDMCRS